MTINNIIEEEFKNKNRVSHLRYRASKFVFVLMALLFFTNLFLCGATGIKPFFKSSITITYVLLIFSFLFFVYFLVNEKFKETINGKKIYIIMGVLIIVFGGLLIPVFMP